MIHLASVNCSLPEAPTPLDVAGVAVNFSLATLSCFFFRPSSSAGRADMQSVDADAHQGLRPLECKPTEKPENLYEPRLNPLQPGIAQYFAGALLLSSQHLKPSPPSRSRLRKPPVLHIAPTSFL